MKLHSDTTSEAVRDRIVAHWRDASPEEKLAEVERLNNGILELAAARQEAWYPDATPEEKRLRLASLWLDRATMIRWFGWDPDVKGR